MTANAADVANFPKVDSITKGQCPHEDGTKKVARQANPDTEIKIKHEYLRSRASTCLSLSSTSSVTSQIRDITAI